VSKLSYASINLRFNPFGELHPGERQKLACVDVSDLIQHLETPHTIVQFLAGHGRGKTTHLLALHRHFKKFPYMKLYPGDCPEFMQSAGCFVDSIENLSLLARWRVYRRYEHLAVTTHRDLSIEMRMAGLTVKTVRVSSNHVDLLQNIFHQRINYARRNGGGMPTIDVKKIKVLQQKYGDDIRAMEAELYEYIDELRDE